MRKDVSYDSLGNPLTYGNFAEWCEMHPRITSFLLVSDESTSTTLGKIPFPQRRFLIHNKIRGKLVGLLTRLDQQGNMLVSDLEASQHFSIEIPETIYDSPKYNMCCRISGSLQSQIFDCNTSALSRKLFNLMEQQTEVRSLISLYEGNVIPEDVIIHLSPDFTKATFLNVPNTQATRLSAALGMMSRRISGFPKPVWVTSFPMFLVSLVKELECHIVPGTMYCEPRVTELSLERCLMAGDYPYLERIMSIVGEPLPEFVHSLRSLADELKQNDDFSKQDLAIATLTLDRSLFNVTYTMRTDFRKPVDEGLVTKLCEMRKRPVSKCNLPKMLIPDVEDDTVPISVFALLDPGYKKAAETLTMAEFASNPIDALYIVYQTLMMIRETASAFFEQRDPSHEKLEQALPFDDMFALFHMVLMGSEILDLDGLFQFIDGFMRKPVQSSFEYARMLLEVLNLHCKEWKMESCL